MDRLTKMMRMPSRRTVSLLTLLLCLSPMIAVADEPAAKPDLHELAKAAAKTRADLNDKPVAWTMAFQLASLRGTPVEDPQKHTSTMVYQMGDVLNVQVAVNRAQAMERYSINAANGGQKGEWLDLIIRDGAWYVIQGAMACKYRPYEAPLGNPLIYTLLDRSSPKLVDVNLLESKGTLESATPSTITYRVPLSGPEKGSCARALQRIEKMSEAKGTEGESPSLPENLQEHKRVMQDLLTHGMPLKIEVQTGLVVQSGIGGGRMSLRDFHWQREADAANFAVNDRPWDDKTGFYQADSLADLVMINQAIPRRPELPDGLTEARMLNVRTGDFRRVPYHGDVCIPLCFSKDRKRIYVSGTISEEMKWGIFEIDLDNLKHRRLQLAGIDQGPVMHGAVSPDGRTLAVTEPVLKKKMPGQNAAHSLDQQVFLVDIDSGKANPLGDPIPHGRVSWLVDGSGLVLAARKSLAENQPPELAVCRMNLQGQVTPIIKGYNPASLAPKSSIVFQRKGDEALMTCDAHGNSPRELFDGHFGYGLLCPSPDGSRVLMLKYRVVMQEPGRVEEERLYVLDLQSEEIKPIDAPPGGCLELVWR